MSLQSTHGLPDRPPITRWYAAGLGISQHERVPALQSHEGGSETGGFAKAIISFLYGMARKQSNPEENALFTTNQIR